jgi:putative chitinase
MDAQTLAKAANIDGALALKWAEPLTRAMGYFAIVTPIRQAHFIAQIGHESGSFARLVENLNYSAEGLLKTWPARFDKGTAAWAARQPQRIANIVYGGRMGNINADDGWKYRGRGLIQLTGRENYRQAANALGIELLVHPELLEQPGEAATTAAWYWADRGLNTLADAGKLEAITRKINGGVNGLVDRQERYLLAARVLGV